MHKRTELAVKTALLSILLNSALAILKGLVGFFGNSYALIADAIESTTDIFSSFLVVIGLRYASRPADENHPYGHGRAEALFTFLVIVFLVLSASLIIYQSIQHIREPHDTPEPYTLIFLGLIILVKELFYRLSVKRSKVTKSTLLKADAWHHRSDAITSLIAFIGILIALVFGEGFEMADDIAALFASVFILYNAYVLFRPVLGELMDEQLHDELVYEVRQVAQKVEGVLGTEKCFVRKTGMRYHVDLHALVDGAVSVEIGHRISHDLKDRILLEIPEIADVHVHIEPHSAN